MSRVGFVYSDEYLRHDTGAGHPESPFRLEAITEHLERIGLFSELRFLSPVAAGIDKVTAVHDPAYVKLVEETCAKGAGYLDTGDTPVCADSFGIALLSAGGALTAASSVMKGEIDSAFAALRPPGHHAERSRGMGFCIFNNAAITAQALLDDHGLERIAIVDWDVHHGNGTQNIFYESGKIFYFSTHQSPYYPGTGSEDEKGSGEGEGTTLNVPLNAGAGDSEYIEAFEKILVPALSDFKPEFVIVSAGFDAHGKDPLAMMNLSTDGYARLTRIVRRIADEHAGGRLVSLLEGGYNRETLATSVEVHLGELLR